MSTSVQQLYCECCDGAPFCEWTTPLIDVDLQVTIPAFTTDVCTAGTYPLYSEMLGLLAWGSPSGPTVDNPGSTGLDMETCEYPQTVNMQLGCSYGSGFTFTVSTVGGSIPLTLISYTASPFSITYRASSHYFGDPGLPEEDVFFIITEP